MKAKHGVRLTAEELDLIRYFDGLGWTNKAIANQLKRDEDTIGKYRRRVKAESEPHAVRREALKDAQRDHWRTLSVAVWGLRGRFTAPIPSYAEDLRTSRVSATPDRREQLLINALREHHAPDHRLWRLLEAWQGESQRLRGACEKGWILVDQEQRSLDNSDEVIKPIFNEKVVGAWFRRAIGAEEDTPLVESMPTRENPDHAALSIGGVYVAVGPREAVLSIERLARHLVEDLSSSPRHSEVANGYREMCDLEPQIAEAIEEMGLMEGFPGECQFCPARTLHHSRQKAG